jgi:glycerol-3-phosphate dehydrogenase (NAD(P)+)
MKVAVAGGGTWGTTLAIVLSKAGAEVVWWLRNREQAEIVRQERRNALYLPDAPIPDSVAVTANLSDLKTSEGVFLAVPSPAFEQMLREIAASGIRPLWLVSGVKGVLLRDEGRPILQSVLAEMHLPRGIPFCVFSGPNIAQNILREEPTTAVIAGADDETLARVQEIFRRSPIRVYRTDDLAGVQIAGSFKNVIAIAAGVVQGMKLGTNTLGALIVRGLLEMVRVGRIYGAQPTTFWGSAGLGDLVATSFSPDSRNASLGRAVGEGKTLDEALRQSRRVAEGVFATRAFYALSRAENLDLPITVSIYRILFEGLDPRAALRQLMERPLKSEELEDLNPQPTNFAHKALETGA